MACQRTLTSHYYHCLYQSTTVRDSTQPYVLRLIVIKSIPIKAISHPRTQTYRL